VAFVAGQRRALVNVPGLVLALPLRVATAALASVAIFAAMRFVRLRAWWPAAPADAFLAALHAGRRACHFLLPGGNFWDALGRAMSHFYETLTHGAR
jgi:hypothetical protein